jgi:hypothetical protein
MLLKITDKINYEFVTTGEDTYQLVLEVKLNQYILGLLYNRAASTLRKSGAIPQKKIDNLKEFRIEDVDINILRNIEKGMRKQLAEVYWTVKRDGINVLSNSLTSAIVKRKHRCSRWFVEMHYSGVYQRENTEVKDGD